MKGKPSKVQVPSSASQSIFPDFCSNHVAFLVILIAELLAFVLAFNATSNFEAFWIELGMTTLFVQWVAIATMIVLCFCNRWLQQANSFKASLAVYGLSQGVTLSCSALALWGLDFFHGNVLALPFELDITEQDVYFLFRNFGISSIITLVALRYFYIQQQWRHNVETEARAQFQALQARIRPHFLFNSMNTIASLIRRRPEQAEQAVMDLADLFRSSLRHQDKTSLGEELDITRRYLSLEKLRLQERLQVDWQTDDPLPLEMPIPALILQPLVENAVYHGIQPLTSGGCITIRIHATSKEIHIAISNPVPTFDSTERHPQSNRMAQDNIRQRLALAYGDASTMRIQETTDRYSVSFTMPIGQR